MKMTTLLGVPDEKVLDRTTDFTTNKVGGHPDWIACNSQTPKCGGCGRVMALAVQLYCPLDGSPYHRTLYLFTCCNKVCWGNPNSWIALRSQKLDDSFVTKATKSDKTQPKLPSDDWGVAADDWGVAADDWGIAADDWGVAADAWGVTTDDQEGPADDWGLHVDNCGSGPEDYRTASTSGVKGDLLEVNQSHGLRTNPSDIPVQVKQDSDRDNENLDEASDLQGDMVQLNVHDSDGEEDLWEEDYKSSNRLNGVMEPDSLALTEDGVQQMMNLLAGKCEDQNRMEEGYHGDQKAILESYYMSVFEEPVMLYENVSHVDELLRDYESREGGDFENIHAAKGKSKGGAEVYEEDNAVHGDKHFHEFSKMIEACPQQGVRYQWRGKPLFISSPPAPPTGLPTATPTLPAMPTCRECGGLVIYELQLMPALVNFLHVQKKTTEAATEFGTVILYSCQASCWSDDDKTRQEAIIVQPDPDQHLFR